MIKKDAKAKKTQPSKAAHHPRAANPHAHHATAAASHRYFEGIGRRKTSVARVRVMKGSGKFLVNDKAMDKYFQTNKLRLMAEEPLKRLNLDGSVDVSVKMTGGGINAQAEAARHGISRAIVRMNPDLKLQLASLGLLTRDPRMVERKKPGLKKARRAPQWKKR
jgi:small subunit ribosomal protein S9